MFMQPNGDDVLNCFEEPTGSMTPNKLARLSIFPFIVLRRNRFLILSDGLHASCDIF